MATKKTTPTAKDIYQIKVTLLGTKPPVWRRLLVPADLTLVKLHDVLQTAMGWCDEHMHEFRPSQGRLRMPAIESEATVTLSAVLRKAGTGMNYTYDFGDSWEHLIVLENKLPTDPHETYPKCTGGQLACPPEDCGGIPGYYALLKARANLKQPRHIELRGRIGAECNPDSFSLERVNRLLSPMRGSNEGPA